MADSTDVGLLPSIGTPIKRFLMGAPLAERYQDEIAQLGQITDPLQRSQAILDLRGKMFQAGYTPSDTSPILRSYTDQAYQDQLNMGGQMTQDNAVRAEGIYRAHGRTLPARADSVGQMMQRGAQAGAETSRGKYYDARTATDTALRTPKVGAENALAGERGAGANLANRRAKHIGTMEPYQIDTEEAKRNAALGGGGKNFHATVVNPVTNKPEIVLFDEQGNRVSTLGEPPPKGVSDMDLIMNNLGIKRPGAPEAATAFPTQAPTAFPTQGTTSATQPPRIDPDTLRGLPPRPPGAKYWSPQQNSFLDANGDPVR